MNHSFANISNWEHALEHPDWYLHLESEIREFFLDDNKNSRNLDWLSHRRAIINRVAEALQSKQISLGEDGPDWDDERVTIDTAVIHHTSLEPTAPIVEIEALGLLRLYASHFLRRDQSCFGRPLWSGHFRNNFQTFVGYHFLIWQDGRTERLLEDKHIGWHAGNWSVNCRSIAISFHDSLENKAPTNNALTSACRLLSSYKLRTVMPHFETNPRTICPGRKYYGEVGWGQLILDHLGIQSDGNKKYENRFDSL